MGAERQDPETMAYALSEHVADAEPEPEEYLRRFVDELFKLEPGLREHFADTVLTELCEEVARKEDPKHSRAVVALIESIEEQWRQQS